MASDVGEQGAAFDPMKRDGTMRESGLFVVYDIEDNRIRNRVFEACKDYGLRTVQYSVFAGRLSRNRSEELFLRMRGELGKAEGHILVIPVCDSDFKKVQKTGKPLGVGQVDLSAIHFE